MVIQSYKDAKRVLVFGRRRQFDRLVDMAAKLFPNAQIDIWSDERLGGKGSRWWGRRYYSNIVKVGGESAESMFDEIEEYGLKDVLIRCRLLRELPKDTAGEMVLAAFRTWKDILQKYEYDAVLSQGVDSYVIDLLERVAKSSSAPFISAVTTPFPGKIRFTCRGELLGKNINSKEGLSCLNESVAKLMKVDYRADILIGANSRPYSTVLRRLVIDSLKPAAFFLYRLLFRDPKSFSFPCRDVYRKRMVADLSRAISALKMEIQRGDFPEKYVFIPLQFYPESTTDYWVPELEMINHQDVVLGIVKALSELKIPAVIKEHPAAVGRRESNFIARLMSYPNVYFAPLLHPVGELVNKSSLVVGSGTTTMLQALLMGRPALFCGTPFYGTGGAPVLTSISCLDKVKEAIVGAMESYSSLDVSGIEVVEAYFSSSASGSLGSYALIGESAVAAPADVMVSDELLAVLDDAISSQNC